MFRLKRTILGNEYEKYRNRQDLLNMLTECELICAITKFRKRPAN